MRMDTPYTKDGDGITKVTVTAGDLRPRGQHGISLAPARLTPQDIESAVKNALVSAGRELARDPDVLRALIAHAMISRSAQSHNELHAGLSGYLAALLAPAPEMKP